jgi:flagellar biosynthesis GTPase FlhF
VVMLLAQVADAVPVTTPPGTPWWVTVSIGAIGLAGGWLLKVYRTEQQRRRAEAVEDLTTERQKRKAEEAARKRAETVEDADKERKHRKEDDNEVIKQQNDFIERQKAAAAEAAKGYQQQLADMGKELAAVRKKLEACIERQQKAEKVALRYQMRVQHLEELLEVNNVPFKRRNDDDSGVMTTPPVAPPEDSSKGDF